jgi:hypothetical protein
VGKTLNIDYTKVQAELYKKDYNSFFIDGFKALYPDEPFSNNWHIKYFCDLLEEEAIRVKNNKPKFKDYVVNIPYRASKSLLFSIFYNAWVWTWFPTAKFLCVSASETLAEEFGKLALQLINTEWYQKYFGDVFKLTSNASLNFGTDKGGKRKSAGWGGQIMGFGCQFLIVDDPQTGSSVTSDTERNKTITTYRKDVYGRVNNAFGVRFIVQQRIHQQDLSGWLLENAAEYYRSICIPAILSPILSPPELSSYYEDGLFWKSFFPQSRLDEIKTTMGSKDFANQLLQQPTPDEGDMFKKEWFKIITLKSFFDAVGKEPVWNFFIDTATSESEKNAATAIVVSCKIGAYTYVRDVITMRKEFPDMVKAIMSYKDKFYTSKSRLCIEDKSSGIQLLQVLQRDLSKPNIKKLKADMSKIDRARASTVDCENGRVIFIEGNYIDSFTEQLVGFPNLKDKDMVDAFAYAVNEKVTSPLLMVNNRYN